MDKSIYNQKQNKGVLNQTKKLSIKTSKDNLKKLDKLEETLNKLLIKAKNNGNNEQMEECLDLLKILKHQRVRLEVDMLR